MIDRQNQIETFINIYKSINNVKPRWIDFSTIPDEELDNMVENISEENRVLLDGYSPEDLIIAYSLGAMDSRTAIQWAVDMNKQGEN